MSDENIATSIREALERAAALHTEALRQVEELLRDDDVEALDDAPTEIDIARRDA